MTQKLEAVTRINLENAAMIMPILIGLFPISKRDELRIKRIDFLKAKATETYLNKPRRAYFIMATAQKEEEVMAFEKKLEKIDKWMKDKDIPESVDFTPTRMPAPPKKIYFDQHSIDLQLKYLKAELEIVKRLELTVYIDKIEKQLVKFENAKPGFID
jgi:hypothetical protein